MVKDTENPKNDCDGTVLELDDEAGEPSWIRIGYDVSKISTAFPVMDNSFVKIVITLKIIMK